MFLDLHNFPGSSPTIPPPGSKLNQSIMLKYLEMLAIQLEVGLLRFLKLVDYRKLAVVCIMVHFLGFKISTETPLNLQTKSSLIIENSRLS